jgi:glycosyltransferase involved in cell wall biosynthesis
MTLPLISVVIPAFNCQWCIEESLRSVCSQSIENIEVLVVDDGSTDGTADVVRSFGDGRIRLIQQANQGHSGATNTGAKAATGEFIKLVDADDALAPGHLEAQWLVLQQAPEQIASCRWGYFTQEATSVEPRIENVQRDFSDPLEWLICSLTRDEGMMGGPIWLIPRSVWDRAGGYNPSLGLNNDFDFSIRLLLASKGVRYAENAVYCYRKGMPSALSQSRGRKAMTSALQTTLLGCQSLLDRENSPRIRRICADRLQMWLYDFYPEFPDLATTAEERIKELGGSRRPLQGGMLLKCLVPFIGWKLSRRLQSTVRGLGWKHVQNWKQYRNLKRIR